MKSRIKKYFGRLLLLFIFILLIVAYRWAAYYFTFARDAYLYAKTVNIASVVPGQIVKIYIKNNQHVKKNQVLLQLDPRPFQYAVNNANAALTSARVSYQAAQESYQAAKDNLADKKAALALSLDHYKRFKALVGEGAMAVIKLIDVEDQVKEDRARLAEAKEAVLTAKNAISVNANAIKIAAAKLDTAEYNLHHTTLYSPSNGYITNQLLRVGDYVSTGKFLFALVETSRWWAITRYRETVLRRIKIGDSVEVHIDMYPHKTFHGTVESIDWGINREQASNQAAPSSLTYLMPTEDWIRIAQRFKVWIRIKDVNPQFPFRVGSNAKTRVKVK